MDNRVKREIRRDVIERHFWMIQYPWEVTKYNLRLVVRLYEMQFHGQEMKVY
jgi:hypothetical protein